MSRLPHMRKAGGHNPYPVNDQSQNQQVDPPMTGQQFPPGYQQQQGMQQQQTPQSYGGNNGNAQQANQAYYEQRQQVHAQNYNQGYNPEGQRPGQIGQGQQNQAYQQQQQQQKRKQSSSTLVDAIPHAILSSEDSLNYREYRGELDNGIPPNSFQYFIQKDNGNAGPRFIRPTVYGFATDPSILGQLQVPQGCLVQPFAEPPYQDEEPVPFANNSVVQAPANVNTPTNGNNNNNQPLPLEQELFRCGRCHTYVNPFFRLSGDIAICNICGRANHIPSEYLQNLSQRVELTHGVYDLLAPDRYRPVVNDSNMMVVCIEWTQQSISSGVAQQVLQTISLSLDSIQAQDRTSIAIMTYNSHLNYYAIPKDLANDPQLIVVTDIDDPFCPFSRQALFLNLAKDREKIDYLLESLLKQLSNTVTQSQLLESHQASASSAAVVQSLSTAFENLPGRIILVQTTRLPGKGLGKLIKREDARNIMNTDQEKQLYTVTNKTYSDLAIALLKLSITVDILLFGNEPTDLPTISILSTETGGTITHFTEFNPAEQERLHYLLFSTLTRYYAVDCIMTLRTSPGITLEDYHTAKGKVSVRDLRLSSMNSESTLCVSYKQEEKIQETNRCYLQFAVLHTSWTDGTTRIRVINLQLPVLNAVPSLFKVVDLDATFAMITRRVLQNLQQTSIKQMIQQLSSSIISIFHSYRKNCSPQSSPTQLILPESIKLLILYELSLLKTSIFSSQLPTPTSDSRFYDALRITNNSSQAVSNILYSKIYPIHDIIPEDQNNQEDNNSNNIIGTYYQQDRVAMPSTVPCSFNRLSLNGVYLIDNAETIYLYVMKQADEQVLLDLFNTSNYEEIRNITQFPLPLEEGQEYSELTTKVNAIIDQIRRNKNAAYQNIRIVLNGDLFETRLRLLFIEDELRGVMSYTNFISDVHSKIQQKMAA